MSHRLILSALVVGIVAACDRQPAPDTATATVSASAAQPAVAATANPTVRAPDVAVPVAPSPAAIMSQPGPDNTTWELTKVAVTGNLLTVQFNVRPAVKEDITYWGEISQISVVDDATSQRYSVVKDQSGNPLVSHLSGDSLHVSESTDEAATVWIKFPAPPVGTPTISINLPKVGSFDGVPVKR